MEITCSDQELLCMARQIKALAHPLRLAIVCLLVDGERHVQDIFQCLGTTQPNISQHLAVLFNHGFLAARKEANRVVYSISKPKKLEIIELLRDIHCPA